MAPPPSHRAVDVAAGAFGVVVRHSADELVLRHAAFPALVTRVHGFEDAATLAALFEASVARHGAQPMLGTRPVLAVHAEASPRAGAHAATQRRELGPYAWLSYDDAAAQVAAFGAGLRALGVPARGVVAIFADTSAAWFVASHACFREGFTVATVYTSLGAAGVRHALDACGAAAVLTDSAGARLMAATDAAEKAARIVLLPPRGGDADADAVAADAAAAREALPAATRARAHTWGEVMQAAQGADDAQRRAPEPADIALLMFTSGSTGAPKGVRLSHSAIVAACAGIVAWNAHAAESLRGLPGAAAHVAAQAGPHDRALAYLPLAHIFEFVMENAVSLAAGAALGYGSPATLTDASPGVSPGSRGDAPALRATFLTAVPTVLERVRASVDGGLRSLRGARGAVARPAFALAFAVGDAALRRCGSYGKGAVIAAGPHAARGGAHALAARAAASLCRAVFAAPRAALGGGVRFFLAGGAPLSPSTQRYLQVVFGCPVLQGYGLTESCCVGTLSSPADLALGRAGAPVPSGLIKLVPWPEGGYTPSDEPLPRGEVHIGGPAIADGYHGAADADAAADFYEDADGMRWFRTGDIGVVQEDGVLVIVDRRKDLVKLERGEFLSLGKVEAALQADATLVAHVLVVAQSTMKAPTALVVPHTRALRERVGGGASGDDDALLRSEAAAKAVLEDLREAGRRAGLERWEVPVRVRLVAGPWTPENGLVTAALKVRRLNVQAAFKKDVEALVK